MQFQCPCCGLHFQDKTLPEDGETHRAYCGDNCRDSDQEKRILSGIDDLNNGRVT